METENFSSENDHKNGQSEERAPSPKQGGESKEPLSEALDKISDEVIKASTTRKYRVFESKPQEEHSQFNLYHNTNNRVFVFECTIPNKSQTNCTHKFAISSHVINTPELCNNSVVQFINLGSTKVQTKIDNLKQSIRNHLQNSHNIQDGAMCAFVRRKIPNRKSKKVKTDLTFMTQISSLNNTSLIDDQPKVPSKYAEKNHGLGKYFVIQNGILTSYVKFDVPQHQEGKKRKNSILKSYDFTRGICTDTQSQMLNNLEFELMTNTKQNFESWTKDINNPNGHISVSRRFEYLQLGNILFKNMYLIQYASTNAYGSEFEASFGTFLLNCLPIFERINNDELLWLQRWLNRQQNKLSATRSDVPISDLESSPSKQKVIIDAMNDDLTNNVTFNVEDPVPNNFPYYHLKKLWNVIVAFIKLPSITNNEKESMARMERYSNIEAELGLLAKLNVLWPNG